MPPKPRPLKPCDFCQVDIPIACKTCPECLNRLPAKRACLDSSCHEITCQSPGTSVVRTAIVQAAPRPPRQPVSRDAAAAQAQEQLDHDCNSVEEEEEHSRLPDLNDEAGFGCDEGAADASGHYAAGPDGAAASWQLYLNALNEKSSRYWLVSLDELVLCHSVAGYATDEGSLVILDNDPRHVYSVPVVFQGSDAVEYIQLCDCEEGLRTWQIKLTGWDPSSCSREEYDAHTHACMHARAVAAIHGPVLEAYAQKLGLGAGLHDVNRASVISHTAQTITILDEADGDVRLSFVAAPDQHVLMSICSTSNVLLCLHCRDQRACVHCHDLYGRVSGIHADGRLHDITLHSAVAADTASARRAIRGTAAAAMFGADHDDDEDDNDDGDCGVQEDPGRSAALGVLPVTTRPIPFPPLSAMSLLRSTGGCWLQACSGCEAVGNQQCRHCIPSIPDSPCLCGAAWSEDDPITRGWVQPGKLYGSDNSVDVLVCYRRCTNEQCKNTLQYDGAEDGIFNYSNKTLVLYEWACACMVSVEEGGAPFDLQWREMKRRYKCTGSGDRCYSKNTHRKVMQAFMRTLDIDYEASFICPICEHLPHSEQVFIVDGKAMGLKKSLFKEYTPPYDTTATPTAEPLSVNGFAPICNHNLRLELFRWATDKAHASSTTSKQCNVALVNSLALLPECQHVQGLLRFIEDVSGAAEWHLCEDKIVKQFVREVAISYPTCALLAPAFATSSLFQAIVAGQAWDLHCRGLVFAHFPALHQLVSQKALRQVPEATLGSFLAALPLRAAPWDELPQDVMYPADDPGLEDDHVHFPAFPQLLHYLPSYKRSKQQSEEGRSACGKDFATHKGLTPGVFTIFCGHGICLGYKLMSNHEGPSTVHTLLTTRLETGPKAIIYDNACNLHRFSMKRTPHFFKNTMFLIDRLHKWNHHSCGSGYFIDSQPPDLPIVPHVTMKQLNTQVAEQVNSLLDKIRVQVAYMSHDNAAEYLMFFLCQRNHPKIKMLRELLSAVSA